MASLYQIRSEIENFEYDCDPETGELLNALEWDALNMAYEEKVENIACYIKNLTSDIAAFKEEEKALAMRRKQAERKVEYLKSLLAFNMNGQKFSTAKCAVSFLRSDRVAIQDEALVPKKYITKKIEYQIDKNAIKALLKSGKAVKGCQLIENLNTQIK